MALEVEKLEYCTGLMKLVQMIL